MPIYEYECCECCERFELIVFGSNDAAVCPKCESSNVNKMMSVFGFKSGGDKGAASSRVGGSTSGCAGCAGGSCTTCH